NFAKRRPDLDFWSPKSCENGSLGDQSGKTIMGHFGKFLWVDKKLLAWSPNRR
ncbi:hypothetical protein TNCV_2834391, partial [Trichonephila clavipes]